MSIVEPRRSRDSRRFLVVGNGKRRVLGCGWENWCGRLADMKSPVALLWTVLCALILIVNPFVYAENECVCTSRKKLYKYTEWSSVI